MAKTAPKGIAPSSLTADSLSSIALAIRRRSASYVSWASVVMFCYDKLATMVIQLVGFFGILMTIDHRRQSSKFRESNLRVIKPWTGFWIGVPASAPKSKSPNSKQ